MTEIYGVVVRELALLAGASPLVMMGLRNSHVPNRWKLVGCSALVMLLNDLATSVDSIFGIAPPDWLHWNWTGKLACIVTVAVIAGLLPREILRKSGLLTLPSKDSTLPVLGFLIYCTILGSLAAFDPKMTVNAETLAYQLLMPSLAEEPVFRAILPALLSTAMGSPWKIAGAQLGWWWLAISVCFGLGHAVNWSTEGGFEFDMIPFVVVTLFTMPYGWIAARCGSVWPCVIGHSLNNSTYVAMALLWKSWPVG